MNIAISKPKLGKDLKAFLAKKHHMLIDGKWVEAKSGKPLDMPPCVPMRSDWLSSIVGFWDGRDGLDRGSNDQWHSC